MSGCCFRHIERVFDDLDALALQDERKLRLVLEMDVIEFGDNAAVLAIPILELRRHDAARQHAVVKTDLVEKFERRRMIASGARHLIEKLFVGHRLDEGDGNFALRQRKRQAQAHRPRAHHHDGLVAPPSVLARRYLATTSLTAPAQPLCVRSNTMPFGARYFAS